MMTMTVVISDNADDDDNDNEDYVLLQEQQKLKRFGTDKDKQGFTWSPFSPQVENYHKFEFGQISAKTRKVKC